MKDTQTEEYPKIVAERTYNTFVLPHALPYDMQFDVTEYDNDTKESLEERISECAWEELHAFSDELAHVLPPWEKDKLTFEDMHQLELTLNKIYWETKGQLKQIADAYGLELEVLSDVD